jgi:hypothetical protein
MPTLLRVFNGILQSGIFSTAWAVAVLVPIFKRGSYDFSLCYFPVQLLK